MKTKSLCAVALATLFLGGNIVNAVAGDSTGNLNLNSKGTVNVIEGDTEGPGDQGKVVDPEEEGYLEPEDENDLIVNPNPGNIKLEAVTPLKFGDIKNSTAKIEAFAEAIDWNKAGTKVKRGAMVEFADVRTEAYGYTVTATLSEQFTNGTTTLTGSTIDFSNGVIRPEDGNTNVPAEITQAAFQLELGTKQTVATADEAKQAGRGRYVLEFGQSADYDANKPGAAPGGVKDTADKSVKLTVPQSVSSNMTKGTYSAKVLWAIENVK